jgi:hypothetical protein
LAGAGALALQKGEIKSKIAENGRFSGTGCGNGNVKVVKSGAGSETDPIGATTVRKIFP